MVVKLGVSPSGRSIGLGCSRIKCLERCLGLRETKLPESGESYIILSYMHLKSKRLRWAGHVERMKELGNSYRVLLGRIAEKRPLGKLKHK